MEMARLFQVMPGISLQGSELYNDKEQGEQQYM